MKCLEFFILPDRAVFILVIVSFQRRLFIFSTYMFFVSVCQSFKLTQNIFTIPKSIPPHCQCLICYDMHLVNQCVSHGEFLEKQNISIYATPISPAALRHWLANYKRKGPPPAALPCLSPFLTLRVWLGACMCVCVCACACVSVFMCVCFKQSHNTFVWSI